MLMMWTGIVGMGKLCCTVTSLLRNSALHFYAAYVVPAKIIFKESGIILRCLKGTTSFPLALLLFLLGLPCL